MERFQNASVDEVNRSFAKGESITRKDRQVLQSFTVAPLCEMCGDLTNEEMKDVYYLESKNIWSVINIACIITGVYPEALELLKQRSEYYILQEAIAENGGSLSHQTCVFTYSLFNFLLRECDMKGSIKFRGKMPQKLFKFRQMTADQWFENYSTIAAKFFALIYANLGKSEAIAFILAYTAYYLNRSQTFKYHAKSSDLDLNDSI
ncbi:MAG: hypothetical protein IIV16_04250, partial [Alistipes sp.]|nr:hypothetical protein [Alistipes sp.]